MMVNRIKLCLLLHGANPRRWQFPLLITRILSGTQLMPRDSLREIKSSKAEILDLDKRVTQLLQYVCLMYFYVFATAKVISGADLLQGAFMVTL